MEDCSGSAIPHYNHPSGFIGHIPKWPLYALTRFMSQLVINAYFGDVEHIGLEKIPCEGPVILVGNHNNQFVDAFLILAAIPRRIYFIIAAVSLKLPWIGALARLIGAIGVQRPQDSKFMGMGKILHVIEPSFAIRKHTDLPSPVRARLGEAVEQSSKSITQWLLVGNTHTRFRLELKANDRLVISNSVLVMRDETIDSYTQAPAGGDMLVVLAVLTDCHLIVSIDPIVEQSRFVEKGLTRVEGLYVLKRSDEDLEEPKPSPPGTAGGEQTLLAPSAFTVYPKIHQGMVYERVSQTLSAGECLCIFPEGGSHDRPDLLPLKPGVAVFALEAYAAGVRDVLIMPVGLHYFERHRLGSAAVVDVGKPIIVSPKAAAAFEAGGERKQRAVNDLLETVRRGLESVTITAESYKVLQTVQRCSEVYLPMRFEATAEVRHKLQNAFTTIFSISGQPDAALIEQADAYTRSLESHGFRDIDVLRMARQLRRRYPAESCEEGCNALPLYGLLFLKALSLAVCAFLAFPALSVSLPLTHLAAKKSMAAAKASSVKVAGADVVASTRILLFLTCFPSAAVLAALIAALATAHSARQIFVLFPFYLSVTATTLYFSLHLASTVSSLAKQVRCYYYMCLSLASATGGGATLMDERDELQVIVRKHVHSATKEIPADNLAGLEACAILESICPDAVVRADTERLRQENSNGPAAVYRTLISTRDEII